MFQYHFRWRRCPGLTKQLHRCTDCCRQPQLVGKSQRFLWTDACCNIVGRRGRQSKMPCVMSFCCTLRTSTIWSGSLGAMSDRLPLSQYGFRTARSTSSSQPIHIHRLIDGAEATEQSLHTIRLDWEKLDKIHPESAAHGSLKVCRPATPHSTHRKHLHTVSPQ